MKTLIKKIIICLPILGWFVLVFYPNLSIFDKNGRTKLLKMFGLKTIIFIWVFQSLIVYGFIYLSYV